jgi:hypothetical protein
VARELSVCSDFLAARVGLAAEVSPQFRFCRFPSVVEASGILLRTSAGKPTRAGLAGRSRCTARRGSGLPYYSRKDEHS